MSEQLRVNGEKSGEQLDSGETKRNLERLQEAASKAEHDPQNNIESIQRSIENQAISGQELNVGDTGTENSTQSFGTSKQLKMDSYKSSLRKVRKQMNAPERVLSRVVHQKVVESVSNTAAKTVARPSAFLGGSIGALLGSAVLLYLSRQNGFTYNYAVFLLLFVSGFVLGALIELIYKLVFRRRHTR